MFNFVLQYPNDYCASVKEVKVSGEEALENIENVI